jgi:acetyltransferase-like isoleucine patch superfamily enzyme
MIIQSGVHNIIEPGVQINAEVILGSYNYIGKDVVIGGFKDEITGPINIGDCNFIYENTRIIMGPEGLSIGDWNVFHNRMLLMGIKRMEIGHNCWFGQNTILDSAGGLYIGNGVRVGMNSQVWTHVASGELIEGCTLYAKRTTHIEDEVWLVGSCIVGSGLRISRRSICMIGSVLSKDTEPGKIYGGVPAVKIEKLNFWKEVTLDVKMQMMLKWAEEFQIKSNDKITVDFHADSKVLRIMDERRGESLIFHFNLNNIADPSDDKITYFDLKSKTYTKRLTALEREFYKFIFNHKARFIPAS